MQSRKSPTRAFKRFHLCVKPGHGVDWMMVLMRMSMICWFAGGKEWRSGWMVVHQVCGHEVDKYKVSLVQTRTFYWIALTLSRPSPGAVDSGGHIHSLWTSECKRKLHETGWHELIKSARGSCYIVSVFLLLRRGSSSRVSGGRISHCTRSLSVSVPGRAAIQWLVCGGGRVRAT